MQVSCEWSCLEVFLLWLTEAYLIGLLQYILCVNSLSLYIQVSGSFQDIT
jgi:hypothetical protein